MARQIRSGPESLVAELLQLKVDIIVSPVASGILAAKQATQTIPIVIVANQDPVAMGIVNSLARPGGNITGVTRLTRELAGKRLDCSGRIPRMSGVGILLDAESTVARIAFKEYEVAGKTLQISLQSLEVRSSKPDFEERRTAAKKRVSALITLRNPLLIDNRKRIAELAIQNRMPSMSEGRAFSSKPAFSGLIRPTKTIASDARRLRRQNPERRQAR